MKTCFRCSLCGEDFYLNDEDEMLYEEGWFNQTPDVCPECNDVSIFSDDYETYSDADTGL